MPQPPNQQGEPDEEPNEETENEEGAVTFPIRVRRGGSTTVRPHQNGDR